MAEYQDYMIRAIAANDEIRAFAVTSRNLVEEARKAHNTKRTIPVRSLPQPSDAR